MNGTDMCSCGTRGCTQMINPDVDAVDPQITERIDALETERATAEMDAERLDDAEQGWGSSLRARADDITAAIDQIMSDNHIQPAVAY